MKSYPAILFSLLCAAALTVQIGCDNDDDGVGVIEELQIEGSCNDYCEQAKSCDDGVDVEACENDCFDAMSDCQADEQEEALNDIDSCSEEACSEFVGCSIGAGLQCSFGV
ncbi:MAG: hypothetical protein ACE37F_38215 [Nannocystaceae bacterium]|nr:hypothetical protein [bacterium]